VSIQLLTADNDLSCYEAWVRAHPQGTLWQSLVRKRYAEECGKEVRVYVASDERQAISDKPQASALVVIDRTTGGFSTWEIARGPLWESGKRQAVSGKPVDVLLERIVEDAKREHCLALYLSLPNELRITNYELRDSNRRVHAKATRIIDLTLSESEILAQMHPKGRYNISIAERHGVTVSEGSVQDIDAFYDLLKDTGSRDGFKIHQKSHYTRFLDCIEGSFLLMAKHSGKPFDAAQGKPIAGLIGVVWGLTGIYYYGASSHDDRALMAPYLLQWEAMRKCKTLGCTKYDLLGIEPEEKSQVPSPKSQVLHHWAGISEFKRKFGGTVITYPPEQMIVLRPWIYKALQVKRKLLG